jgi:hypothetical protein
MNTWIIEQMWVKPAEGDLSNVVITAAWRCNGSQESDGKTYSGTCYGTASFAAPDQEDFIPFEDLTEGQVLAWVWASGIDKEATEASVDQQIASAINPPIVVPPLPWLQNNA